MPFGLKNVGATYQRAIQTCLADHWGKRVEAYVDDVVIKPENSENFIEDLQLVLNSLRRYRWKLNPEKCVFGVPAGKLLGFIITNKSLHIFQRVAKEKPDLMRKIFLFTQAFSKLYYTCLLYTSRCV